MNSALQQRAWLRDRELAVRLGVSRSYVHKMRSRGDLPEPTKLGRVCRWNLELIELWERLGCPQRDSRTWREALEARDG